MNTYYKYKKEAEDYYNSWKKEYERNKKLQGVTTDYYLLECKYKELKRLLQGCETFEDFKTLQKRWN